MTNTSTRVRLSAQDVSAVIEATALAVEQHYVFTDVARELATIVRARLGPSAPEATDAEDLARQLTHDLQQINGDRHLRLKFHPDGVVDEIDEQAWLAAYTAESEQHAHGIACVRRLDSEVAYLELRPKLYHPSIAGDALAAAMRLASTANALVIDLRQCVGGSPETVALVCSYLFEDETHLTDQHGREPDSVRQWWTMPWVPGPTMPHAAVRVLTSAATFSGAEDLAYTLQQSGRARVVGETTGGGAHPRIGVTVHAHLEVTVPVAYSRNSVSQTNWEGVGVLPDVASPADAALATALTDLSEQHPEEEASCAAAIVKQ
jgi:C-terminal processing protease CtpA/Prc